MKTEIKAQAQRNIGKVDDEYADLAKAWKEIAFRKELSERYLTIPVKAKARRRDVRTFEQAPVFGSESRTSNAGGSTLDIHI